MIFTPNAAKKQSNTIGLTESIPRLLWKDHEHEDSVNVKLVRDILTVSASRAGVERLYNCARDACRYCRGQLKPDTIKDLMLHLFSTNLDLKQSEIEMIKKYLSIGEATMLDQMRKLVVMFTYPWIPAEYTLLVE